MSFASLPYLLYFSIKFIEQSLKGDDMQNTSIHEGVIETQKKDAKEMIDLLRRVPVEKQGEVRGIITGFILGVESEAVKVG